MHFFQSGLKTHPKVVKTENQRPFRHFWGMLGLLKWSIKFSLGTYLGTKKQHFGCPNENSETTYTSPTFPKTDGIAFGLKRVQLLDELLE